MADNKFRSVSPSFDFTETDREVLGIWEKGDIFRKTEAKNKGRPSFVFFDGPPTANGLPHIGHIMQSSLKDVWPRFKIMQGFSVMRKAGWDTHGLPVELAAESDLGFSGKPDIEKYGVKKFIEYCRGSVLKNRDVWMEVITRLGRAVDFENDYITMSSDYIQTDWWVMKVAHEKGLLYKDFKILPYCARCGTGLSNHELAQGYQDVSEIAITAKFRLVDDPSTALVAWTTTPWTLLGNLALCVNAKVDYSKVRVTSKSGKEEFLVLATDTIESNKKALGDSFEIVEHFSGETLVGKEYQPLWPFCRGEGEGNAHIVISDDYVNTEDGTGIVHIAFYGEEDFRLIKKNGLVQNQHVGGDGHFKPWCGSYAGRFFKEKNLDVDIVKDLAARDLLFDKFKYEHSYPHCWRCKTPLMYFAKSSWFIRTTAFKDVMIEQNRTIKWHPPHIQEGRFGNWLENNIDWAISRDRYWGSPLNIWTSEKDPNDRICVASVKELQERGAVMESTGGPVPDDIDIHIPIIDEVIIRSANGTVYRREPGVLDTWFNSGAMPWGQHGYPLKEGSKQAFESQYPADFICEAIDQTRGWFYTLLAESCLVTGRAPFKNVICTELVLDDRGKKMSKSLGNVVAPLPLIDKFGADAVRWTFYQSDPWTSKRYSDDLPKEALRSVFIPLWNCYSFFVTYALLDGWTPSRVPAAPSPIELDRWILSLLRTTTLEVTRALEDFDIATTAKKISNFIESLSNWYIRRSRKRFWKSESDEDKNYAYATLYTVLVDFSTLIAPLSPFIAEVMYQNLVRSFDDQAPESVHLRTWLDPEKYAHEPKLEDEIGLIQEAASLARALRVEHDLKIRQPLRELLLTPANSALSGRIERHLESLREEVNVKSVRLVDSSASFVDVVVKPNWKVLGPRFGQKMPQAAAAIQAISPEVRATLASGKEASVRIGDETVTIRPEEIAIEHRAKEGVIALAGSSATVALTTDLTPELVLEGNARELLSVIQRQRKSLDFDISDYIEVKVWGEKDIADAVSRHKDYIAKECLARSFDFVGERPTNGAEEVLINGKVCFLELKRSKTK